MSSEPRVFHFPQGLPGFETHNDFKFIPEEDKMLAQLTSVQEEKISFVLIRPEAYFPDYLENIKVDEESLKVLKVEENTPVDVWVVLTLNRQDISKTTANLRAPLFFNSEQGLGMQVIFNDDRYQTRQRLFKEESPQPVKEGVAG